MRVLVVVDPQTGPGEFESLIETARSIDERGRGLRLFWFARLDDFNLAASGSLNKPVWRVGSEDQSTKSLFPEV